MKTASDRSMRPRGASVPEAANSVGQAAQSDYRPDIEGLRAVAILLVFAFHAGFGQPSGGFVGVDVFFVISGYLITHILVRELRTSHTLSLAQFYARRARRLVPANLAMVLGVMALCALRLTLLDQRAAWRGAVSAITYLSNFWFLKARTDYFDSQAAAYNPFLHTWSLAVEEQFYLVWPWLLIGAWRLGRGTRLLMVVMAAASLLSFASSLLLERIGQPYAFFLLPSRFWEFGVGGMLALLPVRLLQSWRPALGAAGWLGAVCLGAAAFGFNATTPFPGYAALLPAVGSALLLVSGSLGGQGAPSRVLASRPMQWIGGLSYSLYLWHWPILVFYGGADAGPVRIAGCVVATFLLSMASQRWVENPIRFSPALKRSVRRSLALSMGLTVACLALGLLWWHNGTIEEAKDPFAVAARDNWKNQHPDCMTTEAATRATSCTLGDPNGSTTIVLYGDSHAWHWGPALDVIARQEASKLTTFVKPSCPSALIDPWNDSLGRPYTECGIWRREAVTAIIALKPQLVVTSAFSQYSHTADHGSLYAYEEWRRGYAAAFQQFQSAGIPLLLIADGPAFGQPVPTCLARQAKFGSPCPGLPAAAAMDAAKRRAETDAAAAAHVLLADFTRQLCPEANARWRNTAPSCTTTTST